MSWEIVTIACTACVFLSPAAIVGIVLRHREKMAQISKRAEANPNLVEEVRALRRELSDLRETTTHFDMSFDAAIQRVESRIDQVEANQTAPAYGNYTPTRATATDEPPQTIIHR